MPNIIVVSTQPEADKWPELVTAITKLHPQLGDILIVDPDLVDPSTFEYLECPGVVPVPIIFAPDGALSLLPKADAKRLLEDLLNSPVDTASEPDRPFRICAGCDAVRQSDEMTGWKQINNLWYCRNCAQDVEE